MAINDLRYAWRNLIRTPGFTAVAVLTLGLGIAANTAIFSIVNAVVLRPLAYRDSGRLMSVKEVMPAFASSLYPTLPVNAQHFKVWRKDAASFDGIALVHPTDMNLTGSGTPERVSGARVSATFFPILRVEPHIGRNFTEEEDQVGHGNVVLLTDGFWRRRFGADPGVIGRSIVLDSTPYVVIGVLPRSFRLPALVTLGFGAGLDSATEFFVPAAPREEAWLGDFNYGCIARLKPGVTRDSALAELDAIQRNITESLKEEKYELRASLVPLRDEIVGKARTGLVLLLTAVAAVLLIVCVNLANLMLARTAARKREAAIRTALGAGRAQLLRQSLAESVLMSAAGGGLGMALAYAALGLLLRYAPANLPRVDEVTLDARVLLFGLLISALTAILCGALPAWRLSGADPQDALRASSRTSTEGNRGFRTRHTLIGLEVGLSTVLLIVAGLLMTSFVRLMQSDKGFNADRLMAAQIGLARANYKEPAQRTAFLDRVLHRLEAVPGIASASVVNALPMRGEVWVNSLEKTGEAARGFERPSGNIRFAGPSYFKTMGIPIVRGRTFEDADRSRPVIIVSARVAAQLWPGENPIGKQLRYRPDDPFSEVIGVAADVRAAIDIPAPRTVYVPYWQSSRVSLFLVVRTGMDPRAAVRSVRQQVWKEDPEIPVPEMLLMADVVSDAAGQRRFEMWLTLVFAAAALGLACLGIYGVVSHAVARRTNEMGIRTALGARASDLHRMVLGQAMRPVAIGLAAGVAAALSLARVLRSMLFEMSAADPRIMAAAVATLAAVAAVACFIPARRASRVDPVVALRYE